jgi:hypothetical protein
MVSMAPLTTMAQWAVEDSSVNLQPVTMGLEEHEYPQQVNACLPTLDNPVAGP